MFRGWYEFRKLKTQETRLDFFKKFVIVLKKTDYYFSQEFSLEKNLSPVPFIKSLLGLCGVYKKLKNI